MSLRRYFDPAAYRIVLLDQRNCGRSMPHASDLTVSLTSNTTQRLLSDIEKLREHLGIDRPIGTRCYQGVSRQQANGGRNGACPDVTRPSSAEWAAWECG